MRNFLLADQRIFFHHFHQLEAVHLRHIDVGDNKEWLNIGPLQEGDDRRWISEKVNFIRKTHVGKDLYQQMQIIVIIVN
jgi:hypothetical protein